jgi:hypothetical protein
MISFDSRIYIGSATVSVTIVLSGVSLPQMCPSGSWCPIGTAAPVSCPMGFFCEPGTGVAEPCLGGYFGEQVNLTLPECSGRCREGFYCKNGSSSRQAIICVPGYFCPSGSSSPILTCPSGTYCPLGAVQPVPCPPGLVAITTAASNCSACAVGTFPSAVFASSSCSVCPTTKQCFAGNNIPLSSSLLPNVPSQRTFVNPFTDSQTSTAQLIASLAIGLGTSIAIVVVVCALLGSWIEIRPPAAHDAHTWLSRLDIFFDDTHFLETTMQASTVVAYRTRMGGTMSVACIFTMLATALLLGAQNLFASNQITTVTINALPIEPIGMFRLTLVVYGGSAAQCTNSSQGSLRDSQLTSNWILPPGVDSASVMANLPTFNVATGACTLIWQCPGCTLLAPTTTITYTSPNLMWASFLQFTFETPALLSVASGTPVNLKMFSVSGFVFGAPTVADSRDVVLQGAQPSVVSLLLTAYLVNYTTIAGNEQVAFQPSVTAVTPGSLRRASVDGISHATPSLQSTLSVHFAIGRNTLTVQTYRRFNFFFHVFNL